MQKTDWRLVLQGLILIGTCSSVACIPNESFGKVTTFFETLESSLKLIQLKFTLNFLLLRLVSTQNSKKYWIIHFCGRIPELFKAKILLLWRIGPAQQYVRMTSTVLRFLPNYYFTYLLIHIPTIARFIRSLC